MGINACILRWLGEIADAGVFAGQKSLLELGPQDFFFPEATLVTLAGHRLDKSLAEQICQEIMSGQKSYEDRQRLFYSIFGLTSYASVDTYDERATYRQNLNTAAAAPIKFDVIIDAGTTEHVFNLANVFVYTHNSLNVGGMSLKILPTFGDNGHGFYNIHPTVYFDIARENNYEILDFRYVDDMISRPEGRGASSLSGIDDWQQSLQSFAGCASIQEHISRNFLRVLQDAEAQGRMSQAHNSADYCFVAMRKRDESPFRYPGQGVYLSEFPPSAHLAQAE